MSQKGLGCEPDAAFSAAARQNLPATVGGHAGAESGLMCMFDLRGLVSFLSHGWSPFGAVSIIRARLKSDNHENWGLF